MDSPSIEARALLDEIEGLALYIGMAETDRLNALNPPDQTLEHYQALLPYAVALELEDAWGARFASVLAAHAAGICQGGGLHALRRRFQALQQQIFIVREMHAAQDGVERVVYILPQRQPTLKKLTFRIAHKVGFIMCFFPGMSSIMPVFSRPRFLFFEPRLANFAGKSKKNCTKSAKIASIRAKKAAGWW
jgi:hypothetical protein